MRDFLQKASIKNLQKRVERRTKILSIFLPRQTKTLSFIYVFCIIGRMWNPSGYVFSKFLKTFPSFKDDSKLYDGVL